MINVKKESCSELVQVFDFFNVMSWLSNNELWDKKEIHDDMFELIDAFDEGSPNDSYQRIYRHWIKKDNLKLLFDIICAEFGITHEFSKYSRIPEDETKIVFWVSW
jgi:hypothetical protein